MAPDLVTLEAIEAAHGRIRDRVHHTPLRISTTFSRMTGGEVHLKYENQQRTGSFKIRGALNKMETLTQDEAARGVIAASAGNHAQGVALAATTLGIESTIVMPQDAPIAKVEATEGYGATVVLHGDDFNAAYDEAQRLCSARGLTFVHPFDDPAIIAGQGTVGIELLEDLPDVDVVVCGLGGGGVVSGIAAAVKAKRPDVRVVAVEAEGAASALAARQAGHLVRLDTVDTIADGISTKTIGETTFAHVEALVDDIVTVSDAQIAHAILMLLERSKNVVEGAGAAALAALLAGKVDVADKKVACVVSGGNIDMTMLGQIIHRGLMEAGRVLRFTTVVSDKPGGIARIIDRIAEMRGNLITVEHDRDRLDLPLKRALVDVEVETRSEAHAEEIVQALEADGFSLQVTVGTH